MESRMVQHRKALAGYHLLIIIAKSDGLFSMSEETVIKKYLASNPEGLENIDDTLSMIKEMKNEDRFYFFQQAAADYYALSTNQERMAFINLVFDLIKSDQKITVEENLYLNELYNTWGLD